MIDAIERASLGSVTVPGATVRAELVRDAQGRGEIWIFVHPCESRRAVTLLHLDIEAWRRLSAFVMSIQDRIDSASRRLPTEETHRSAYR